MKFLEKPLFFLFLLGSLNTYSQQNEVYLSLQTGSPFRVVADEGPSFILNFNFGVEKYMIDKLSIALSYRFVLFTSDPEVSARVKYIDYQGLYYNYTEYYDSHAIDIESKFFFDDPNDDSWYISSMLSFQHLTMNINVTDIYGYGNGPGQLVLNLGKFSDDFNIYPFAIKIGKRSTGDVVVFDYFFGIAYHLGAGSIKRINENYLDYYKFKTVSFPVGMKLGFKF